MSHRYVIASAGLACLLLWLFALDGRADSLVTEEGLRVEMLSRVAIEGLDGQPPFLLLDVAGRDPFLVPDEAPLPLSNGVEVSVTYRPAAEQGELDLACRIVVTAVWLEQGGEEHRQAASQPFQVLDNTAPECR
ncbi:MAG: hypothetical protein ACXIUB_09935 [Wenzhouxiangella sp.]